MGTCKLSGAVSHEGNLISSPSALFMKMLQARKNEVIFSPFCKMMIFFFLFFLSSFFSLSPGFLYFPATHSPFLCGLL